MTPSELDIDLFQGSHFADLMLPFVMFESKKILSSIGSPHICCYHLTGFL